VKGKPVTELLDTKTLDEIIERTRRGGSEIVSLLGKGSAYYAPSAAIYTMARAIILDQKKTFPVSAYLQGQYGLSDIYLGVPAKLGKSGIEEIIELPLNREELSLLHHSAEITRKSIQHLCQ
jgi:malate dehydrogenase